MKRHDYGDDRAQFGELTLPPGDQMGTVVIVHGGFAAWNLEYRRVGDGGGWPTTFDDIAAGIDAAHRNLSDGAALDLMGGAPADRPDAYAAADPMAAIPLAVPVVCVHARADRAVPFAQSVAYVTDAREAGADAQLVEAGGDHFTVIDPVSSDWPLVVGALHSIVEK